MAAEFRTEPPWKSENADAIPTEYTIIAEFPSVIWGWEVDSYFWILKDQGSRFVLASTAHGKFYLTGVEELQEQIEELTGFIKYLNKGLSMLESLRVPTSADKPIPPSEGD